MKIENGNMKMQNLKMQNMKMQNMKMQNMKIQNMKMQNMKIQSMKMQNIKMQNMKMQNMKMQNMKIQNVKMFFVVSRLGHRNLQIKTDYGIHTSHIFFINASKYACKQTLEFGHNKPVLNAMLIFVYVLQFLSQLLPPF